MIRIRKYQHYLPVNLLLIPHTMVGILGIVPIQRAGKLKPLTAGLTLVLEVSLLLCLASKGMFHLDMVVQAAVMSEPLAAFFTNMGLDAQVDVDMFVQGVTNLEHVTARFTTVFIKALRGLDEDHVEVVRDLRLAGEYFWNEGS